MVCCTCSHLALSLSCLCPLACILDVVGGVRHAIPTRSAHVEPSKHDAPHTAAVTGRLLAHTSFHSTLRHNQPIAIVAEQLVGMLCSVVCCTASGEGESGDQKVQVGDAVSTTQSELSVRDAAEQPKVHSTHTHSQHTVCPVQLNANVLRLLTRDRRCLVVCCRFRRSHRRTSPLPTRIMGRTTIITKARSTPKANRSRSSRQAHTHNTYSTVNPPTIISQSHRSIWLSYVYVFCHLCFHGVCG